MRSATYAVVLMFVAALAMAGCSTSPKSESAKAELTDDAQQASGRMTSEDAALQPLIDKAYGHVIFPTVGKGGVIIGGAYGKGVVYEQGRMIGYADLTQASVGAQLGGQTYSELILFESKDALDRFRNNRLEFAANASAVILKSGAAKAAKYENGVAVFTMPKAGAMVEASIGGQKFTFKPEEGATTRPAAS